MSICTSVWRWHGLRSLSQVCFGKFSNCMCMLIVVIGRRLLIFSHITFKVTTWQPYWVFWFPNSNFSLALDVNSKLQKRNTCVYMGRSLLIFTDVIFRIDFSFLDSQHGFQSISRVCFGISISDFMYMSFVAVGRSLMIFSKITFKKAAWWPYGIFQFPDF